MSNVQFAVVVLHDTKLGIFLDSDGTRLMVTFQPEKKGEGSNVMGGKYSREYY